MGKLEDALRKASKAFHDDANARAAKETNKYTQEGILKGPKEFDYAIPRILAFALFCKSCRVKIGKTKVLRTSSYKQRRFMHRGRSVRPDVLLIHGDQKTRVDDVEDIDSIGKQYEWDPKLSKTVEFIQARIPGVIRNTGNGHETRLPMKMVDLSIEYVDAFLEEAGPNWTEIVEKVRAHFKFVEANTDKIVSEHFGKRGPAERKIFRDKFCTSLAATKGLIDAPPEAILAVFKLGWQEIETLMKFTRKNKADVDLVELEDIVTAQDEARVKTVMET